MNRVAKRRLSFVGASAAVLAAGVFTLYEYREHQLKLRMSFLRAEGLATARSGDYGQAVLDLQQYLVRNSTDLEALAEYCRVRPKVVSADRSHLRETLNALRYYVSLNPTAVEERSKLLQLYLDYSLNTEALDTSDHLLVADPDNAGLLAAKTEALTRLRRMPEALVTARHWIDCAPDSHRAVRSWVELQKLNGIDDGQILADVDRKIASRPASLSLRMARAQALIQAARIDDARSTLVDASKLSNPSPDDAQALAEMMDRVGLFDESVSIMVRLAETHSGDAAVDLANRQSLARRLWERGETDRLVTLIDSDHSLVVDQPDLQIIYGLLLQKNGRAVEAERQFATVEAAPPDATHKAWSAIARQGDAIYTVTTAKAIVDLISDALIDRPKDPYLLYFLGDAYARAGDQDLAIAMWLASGKAAPSWSIPLMRAAEVLVAESRFDDAMSFASAAVVRSQRMATQTYVQTWAAALDAGRRNDGADLLAAAELVHQQVSDQPWVNFVRASALASMQRKEEAQALLNADLANPAVEFKPADLLRVRALQQTLGIKLDAASLSRREGATAGDADLSLARFAGDAAAVGNAEALRRFEAARAASSTSADLSWRLAEARVRDASNDSKAAETWRSVLADSGDRLDVLQSALASSSLWRDRATIDTLIERVRAIGGERGLTWRVYRARWLLEGSAGESPDVQSARQAADLLTGVLLAAPESITARFYEARAQDRLGNRGSAIEHLMTASRLSPSSAPIALYAAQLLQEQGDFARARQQLERLTAQDLIDAQQSALAASLLAQQGRSHEAIGVLERMPTIQSDEQADLLLAMLYRREGDFAKTRGVVEGLMRQPTLAAIAFAADFYRAQGDAAAAARTLQHLDQLAVDPALKEMTLADFEWRSGNFRPAREHSIAATRLSPKNLTAWRNLLLNDLQEGNVDAARTDLAQAVAALPADASLAALQAPALWRLIESAVRDPMTRPLALAIVRDPSEAATRDALALAEQAHDGWTSMLVDGLVKLADASPLNQSLQQLTAELLLQSQRNAEAAAVATRGVESFPTDETMPRIAAQAMIAAREWSQAKAFAARWRLNSGSESLAPDLTAAIAALGLNDSALAEAMLRPHLSEALADLEHHGETVSTLAIALYATGKTGEAESIISKAIAATPAFARQWVAEMATSLPTPTVEFWLRSLDAATADSASATVVTRAWLQVALRTKDDQRIAPIIRQRVDTLVERSDLEQGDALTLAIIADQLQMAAVAERLYRKVLEHDASNVVALNNLAMLLVDANRGHAEAVTLSEHATTISPATPGFLDTYARALAADDQLVKARQSITAAIRMEPANAAWQLTAAEIDARSGSTPDLNSRLQSIRNDADTQNSLSRSELVRLDRLQSNVSGPQSPPPLPTP